MLCFSENDYLWVREEILRYLEDRGYYYGILHRDFQATATKLKNINMALQRSRLVIAVVSRYY